MTLYTFNADLNGFHDEISNEILPAFECHCRIDQEIGTVKGDVFFVVPGFKSAGHFSWNVSTHSTVSYCPVNIPSKVGAAATGTLGGGPDCVIWRMLLNPGVVFLHWSRIPLRSVNQIETVDRVVIDMKTDLIANVQVIEKCRPLYDWLWLLAHGWAILKGRIASVKN